MHINNRLIALLFATLFALFVVSTAAAGPFPTFGKRPAERPAPAAQPRAAGPGPAAQPAAQSAGQRTGGGTGSGGTGGKTPECEYGPRDKTEVEQGKSPCLTFQESVSKLMEKKVEDAKIEGATNARIIGWIVCTALSLFFFIFSLVSTIRVNAKIRIFTGTLNAYKKEILRLRAALANTEPIPPEEGGDNA